MKERLSEVRNHMMTGVSYMIPVVVIGGIFLAAALATGTPGENGMEVTNPFMQNILLLGEIGFMLMIPVLAGYIAYSISGKPALAPAFVLGHLANTPVNGSEFKAGFLGALLMGILVGYFVKWLKTWKVPQSLRALMPIFIIPLFTTFVLGMFYIYVLATPISAGMASLTTMLGSLSGSASILLAVVLGLMIAVDMGGPINKVAVMFCIAMSAEGNYQYWGQIAIAICTPPLGMGLATLLAKKKYTESERDAGKAALAMGMIGITEGAIPFAAADPVKVLPSIMTGSAVGAVIGAIAQVKNYAPHGGPIVLPVIDGKLWYVVAIIAGSVVTALMVNALKKEVVEEEDDSDFEFTSL